MTTRPQFAEPGQSTWLDVAAFGVALLLGVAAYFGIRAFSGRHSQVLITFTLIVFMIAYAVAVRFVPKLRVRMDQAGDNAYYLGLLFTLMSMAFALYDFGVAAESSAPSSGVRQIIANFGIALGTTIAGIFLRVVLHQMRVDPADLEAMTRIELTEAAERLRSTLETATTNLSRFHLEVQQRANDTLAEMTSQAKNASDTLASQLAGAAATILSATAKTHEDSLAATQQVTGKVTELATEAAAAVDRLRSVEPPPVTLAKRLEKVATGLESVAVNGERADTALTGTAEALKKAYETTTATAERLATVSAAVQGEQARIAKQLADTVATLERDIQPFSAGLKAVLGDLQSIQKEAKGSAEESAKAHTASVEVLNSLSKVARELANAMRTA